MSTVSTLSDWLVTPQGQYIMSCERPLFEKSVADIFGFNALQIGMPQHNLLYGSRIPLHIQAGKEAGVKCWLEAEELPFETGSLDLVVLSHVLEFSSHPHQILREVERVLRPEGNVILSGFNPFSLWGMRRTIGQKTEYPWRGNFISLPRLKDWLALLGFEVEAGRYTSYVPPFAGAALLGRSQCMEPAGDRWWSIVGGVYILKAKKRVPGMRLIKPNWNGRLVRKLIPASAKLNKDVFNHSSTEIYSKGNSGNNE